MLQSDALDQASWSDAQREGRPVCSSTAGSYHVSKTYFRLRVDEVERNGKPVNMFRYITVQRRPDRDKGYCLDFLASPTSYDKVRVYKTNLTAATAITTDARANANPTAAEDAAFAALEAEIKQLHPGGSDLIQVVATDAIDESAYIAKVLIRTLFVGLSGNAGFSPDRALTGDSKGGRKLDLEYDPFDLPQTAQINDALRRYGFCVLVQGITFERDTDTIDSYCDNPKRAIQRSHRLSTTLKLAEEARAERRVRGILYRPRLPYTVALFVKDNMKVPGGWRLRATEIVEMENISPVLAIGVERAFAAQRKTMVFFDQGVVQDVCIYKSSELQPLVEVPLEIARSIVALPANIVQVQINSLANDKSLVEAEQALIQAQIDHLKLLDAQQKGIASDVDASKLKTDSNGKPVESTTRQEIASTLQAALDNQDANSPYASARRVRSATDTVCGKLRPQNAPVAFTTPFGFDDANGSGGSE